MGLTSNIVSSSIPFLATLTSTVTIVTAGMDSPAHGLALGVFLAYYLLIFSLFYVVLSSLALKIRQTTNVPKNAARLFGFLTLASLVHTWYCTRFPWIFARDVRLTVG
jgi:mannose/fructose/N-acetylgalactosamine-specific phosphotransferase system component IIC